ncbi:MAG: cupin domain-containing protein [Dehalococcoidia bacterium]|nr:cupin domain-containing protein [Dehalococcoidia bacterium]
MTGGIVNADSVGEPAREVLATAPGLRVQLVTVAPGQSIPRHHHTKVSDTLIAVQGTVVVEVDGDESVHRLEPGERFTIPPGTVHRVSGEHGCSCRFLNLHAGGDYDFVAATPGM